MFGSTGYREVKFREYSQCLSDISVTHSPRFRIDIDLPEDESILVKLGQEYTSLNPDKLAELFKEQTKKNLKEGQTLWWLDSELESMSPVIKSWRSLSKAEKEDLMAQAMVYHPEIFSDSPEKYLKLGVFLFEVHQVFNTSLRDDFSAGGKVNINIRGKNYNVSQKLAKLKELAPKIKDVLRSVDLDYLQKGWEKYITNKSTNLEAVKLNPESEWKKIINLISTTGNGVSISKVYESGL